MKLYRASLVRIEHTVLPIELMAESEAAATEIAYSILNGGGVGTQYRIQGARRWDTADDWPDWDSGEVVHAEEFVQDVTPSN